ncbi:MAG: GNAT family N-acetyltransferase [Xanthobacteraceae bacterium]
MSGRRRHPAVSATLRRGRMSDLGALLALEQAVFTVDVLSRRSLRHFLASPGAALIVTEANGRLAGYALVLFPPRSAIARLYSIAVAPHVGGRGVGPLLLAAAEQAAKRRKRRAMRLEVHEHNTRAIARYEKSGYRLFGRHRAYYDDRGDALRFEKPLGVEPRRRSAVAAKKPDAQARIGFHGGHRGPRSRYSVRSRL